MDVAGFFTDPMAYGFMQRGLVAAIVVGIVCAVMGTFVVLKGIAFIGDAVSHASFPGVVIAFIAGLPIYLGGAVAAVGTALAIGFVSRRSRLRLDTAIPIPIPVNAVNSGCANGPMMQRRVNSSVSPCCPYSTNSRPR